MTEPAPPLTDDDERNMPTFARCHDLLRWLVPCVQEFPRAQRHLLAQRVLDTAFDVQEALVRARKAEPRTRGEALRRSDVLLETLRTQWRLAYAGWLAAQRTLRLAALETAV